MELLRRIDISFRHKDGRTGPGGLSRARRARLKRRGRRTHSRSGLVPGRRGGTVGVELVMALGLHAFPVFPLVILAALMSLARCARPPVAGRCGEAGRSGDPLPHRFDPGSHPRSFGLRNRCLRHAGLVVHRIRRSHLPDRARLHCADRSAVCPRARDRIARDKGRPHHVEGPGLGRSRADADDGPRRAGHVGDAKGANSAFTTRSSTVGCEQAKGGGYNRCGFLALRSGRFCPLHSQATQVARPVAAREAPPRNSESLPLLGRPATARDLRLRQRVFLLMEALIRLQMAFCR